MCRNYYVSSKHGKYGNSGLSPEEAFDTLDAVNELTLLPGDKVLLECGSVFENQYLHLSGQGTKEHPVFIGKYGQGALPVINCNGGGIWFQDYGRALDSPTHVWHGEVSSAVLLKDVSHLILSDLEITNQGGGKEKEPYNSAYKRDRTGVAVVAQNAGTLQNITLRNLCIHDVEGNVYNKHMNNGGIYVTALQPDDEERTGVARYEDFMIEGCFVFRVCRWGIAVGYSYQHAKFQDCFLPDELFFKYGHENLCIRNNYVKAAGGDGITTMYALRPCVEHNIVDEAAGQMNARIYSEPMERGGMLAAAIWPWKCKDALFRFNEAADTRLNQDGMAYNADSGDGTVYEYNYSRLNEGGCVMFCLEQSVNSRFSHNVSEDDLGGTLTPVENPDAYIGHNTFYVRENVPLIRRGIKVGNYKLEENQFFTIDSLS